MGDVRTLLKTAKRSLPLVRLRSLSLGWQERDRRTSFMMGDERGAQARQSLVGAPCPPPPKTGRQPRRHGPAEVARRTTAPDDHFRRQAKKRTRTKNPGRFPLRKLAEA